MSSLGQPTQDVPTSLIKKENSLSAWCYVFGQSQLRCTTIPHLVAMVVAIGHRAVLIKIRSDKGRSYLIDYFSQALNTSVDSVRSTTKIQKI